MGRRSKTSPVAALIVGLMAIFIAIIASLIKGLIELDRKQVLKNKDIDQMTGEEFEIYLEYIYKKLNYSVIRTSLSGDQGADLIITKNGIKTVIQAKRWKGKVTNKAIQEVFSAKHYYNADDAIVITSNQFTKSAKDLAYKLRVKLCNRNDLIELIRQANYQENILKQSISVSKENGINDVMVSISQFMEEHFNQMIVIAIVCSLLFIFYICSVASIKKISCTINYPHCYNNISELL